MRKIEFGIKYLKENKKKLLFNFFYILVVAVSFYALNFANVIVSDFYPFAFGLLFALFWSGVNPYLLSIIYFLAGILSDSSEIGIYLALNPSIVVFLAGFLHKKIHKTPKLWVSIFYSLLSQIMFVVSNYGNIRMFLYSFLAVAFGIGFMLVVVNFLRATVKRGFNTGLNLDEQICGAIILIVISMGLSRINFYGIELIKIVVSLIVLVSTYYFSSSKTIFLGAIMGVGYAINIVNPVYISAFVCYALFSLAFKTNYKILSILSLGIVEIIFGLYFNLYEIFSIYSIVSVLIGGVIFLILPKRLFVKITEMFGGGQEKNTIRNIVNKSKENVCKKLVEMSGIFNEMDLAYRQMVKGKLSKNEKKEYLTDECVAKVCKNCGQYNKCFRKNGEYTVQILDELVDSGLEKGKVGLLDVSQYLSSRCIRINQLINTFNKVLEDFRDRSAYSNSLDTSKLLIADQLNGVGGLMKKLAEQIKTNISFDVDCENKIIEDLLYKNIACIEAVVFEENRDEKQVTLLLKNYNIDFKLLENVVSKSCNSKLAITNISNSEIQNAVVVTLKTKPNFDIVFGFATVSKNSNANGDTHSVVRLGNDKYLLAICDGMGNGIKAKETSELSISLIENFYKAGFDNETVLKSVNKLLSLSNKESFSALDLCVLDLRKNFCDFIKLATPSTFIKHKHTTDEIESSGLPIGILEDIKPNTIKTYLSEFDIIVMVSDGITETFSKVYDLKTFVNNILSTNPQTIADEIMKMAMQVNPIPQDDMTVLVARVYPVV